MDCYQYYQIQHHHLGLKKANPFCWDMKAESCKEFWSAQQKLKKLMQKALAEKLQLKCRCHACRKMMTSQCLEVSNEAFRS